MPLVAPLAPGKDVPPDEDGSVVVDVSSSAYEAKTLPEEPEEGHELGNFVLQASVVHPEELPASYEPTL